MRNKEKVILIGLNIKGQNIEDYHDSMEELKLLAETADLEIIQIIIQNLTKPNISTFIGKGKLQEISHLSKKLKTNTLVFNDNLTPAQARNISNLTRCNVVDRTELILDIFAKHARTKQAKLQVELAQLEYSYTKLKRLWKHLSRIQGGIGFRGPGETQIETDRREIRKRTSILKKKIKEIDKNTLIKRKKRSKFLSISMIGYTNAGKTTLFNKLTNEKLYTADKLFATLDSTTRSLNLKSKEKIVLSDTIGFIKKLPHKLVSSFHSTLLEVLEADLLLHVIDISHPDLTDYIYSVNRVLQEIGVEDKDILCVFNKCDLIEEKLFPFLKKKMLEEHPDSIFISAKNNDGIDILIDKIEEFVKRIKKEIILKIPAQLRKLISFIYENAEVIENKYENKSNEQVFRLKIDKHLLTGIKKQVEDFKLKEYLK